MGKFILSNTRIFAGGADLTGATNKVELSATREDKDVTNFNSVDASGTVWKEVIGGLGSAKLTGSGQWEATDLSKVDDESWAEIGATGGVTVFPTTANAGDLAYVFSGLRSSYTLGGQVGDVAPWQGEWASNRPLGRGVGLHPPGTARTTTGTGTSVNVAATSASQYLYANLHVLSVSGSASPTLTVTVQADNATGFPSPATEISFAAATAVGGQTARVVGPITDTWYRVSWTISGTTPSFLFVVSMAIA